MIWNRLLQNTSSQASLFRVVNGFMFVLLACTYPLWQGQWRFPQIPLVAWAIAWPAWIDQACGLLLGVSLLLAVAGAARDDARRVTSTLAAACLFVLWLGDQHRLQPWAYHYLLCAWIFATLPVGHQRSWLRLLLVSVYVYSALGKFDAHFLQTHGGLFVQTAWELTGQQIAADGQDNFSRWAILLPTFELLVAVMLCIPYTRRAGAVAAVILHVGLILVLGPWGLNHRWAVLVWNASFLTQVLLLFPPTSKLATAQEQLSTIDSTPRLSAAARCVNYCATLPIVFALLLPLLEPWGRWDSWLSWGLYSTRAAKIDVYLRHEDTRHLPRDLQTFCEIGHTDEVWVRFAIDRWSLQTLQAPIYPHERFELGVAVALGEILPKGRPLLLIRSSPPRRTTGQSERTQWILKSQIDDPPLKFFWNVRPRSTWLRRVQTHARSGEPRLSAS